MKGMAEKALEYGEKKADYFEVRAERTRMTLNFMKNGVLSSSTERVDSGFAIRAIVDGGMGAAYTNSDDWEGLKKAVESAISLAKRASSISDVKLSDEKTYKDYWTVEQKRKIEDVDNSEKIEWLSSIDKGLKESAPAVARIQILRDSLKEKHILTSEGTEISSLLPTIEYMYFMVVANEKGSEQAYNQLAWTGGYDRWD